MKKIKNKKSKSVKYLSPAERDSYCQVLFNKNGRPAKKGVCKGWTPKKAFKSKKETGHGYGPDYNRLKQLAEAGRYSKAIIVEEYADGTKDLFVEIIQDNGSTKWEEFKRIFPIPDELKLKGLEKREVVVNPVDEKPILLQGVAEFTREQNQKATVSSKNIDPNFEKQIKRGIAYEANTLSEEARWQVYEDIKKCLAKGDYVGARSNLLTLIPGLFAYRITLDEAILNLKTIDTSIKDRPTNKAIIEIQEYLELRKVA